VTREDRLEVAVRIAAEFTARDMRQHLSPLRRYYVEVRDGRTPGNWTDDLVIDWAMAFRVPPFEHALEVRPMSSECVCGSGRHDATRPMCFPGGWLVTCLACRRRWLELQQLT
jgi:hypothetical protein